MSTTPQSDPAERISRIDLLTEATGIVRLGLAGREVADRLVDLASRLIPSDAVAIWRLDRTTNVWGITASKGLSETYCSVTLSERTGSASSARLLAAPFVIEDVATWEAVAGRSGLYDQEGIRKLLVLPLVIRGEPAGTICCYFRTNRPIDDEEFALARTFASIASNALSAQKFDRLAEVARRVSGELNLDRLVQMVTDAATDLTGAAFGAFFYNVVDPEGESYMLYTISGAPREAFEKFPMPRNTEVFAPTFAGTGVVRSANIHKDPRYGKNDPHFGMPKGHLPVVSYLAVPVISRTGQVLGGLFFGHPDEGVFTETEERVAESLAAHAAVAIDNARLYGAAESANHAKDEFLAMLSHELRTPMTAVLGWSRLLKMGLGERETRDAIDAIETSAQVQAQLIEDILDVSRIMSGKLRINPQPVDLRVVTQAALITVGPAAVAKGIEVVTEFAPVVPPVAGDEGRLQQTVWNLISNAIKFTPKGGRVVVRIAPEGSHLRLEVEDNGAGIPTKFLPHVFEAFRQADSSSTRQYGGIGLGLAIVRYLVELQGGRVAVKSDGPGKGTSFIVELPIMEGMREIGFSPQSSAETSGPHSSRQLPSLKGVTVLAVDDQPYTRDVLGAILRRCDAEVETAASVQEAIELLRSNRPDVIVCDIAMPDEDGYVFLRHLRSSGDPARASTPIIALTAFGRPEDRQTALSAGFDAYLKKPVEPGDLVSAILHATRRGSAS